MNKNRVIPGEPYFVVGNILTGVWAVSFVLYKLTRGIIDAARNNGKR